MCIHKNIYIYIYTYVYIYTYQCFEREPQARPYQETTPQNTLEGSRKHAQGIAASVALGSDIGVVLLPACSDCGTIIPEEPRLFLAQWQLCGKVPGKPASLRPNVRSKLYRRNGG